MADLVGVDVGSYQIKAVGLTGSGSSRKVTLAAVKPNQTGLFLPDEEAAFNQLAATLKLMAQENKFSKSPIATALPETLAYTSIISMPFLSDAELASSIHWEAEQHIPVPLEEVQLEYEVLYKPKKGSVGEKMQVLLVAAKKSVVERLTSLFAEADLELVNLETSLLACFRGVTASIPSDQGVALLNMGALSSDIIMIDKGRPVITYAVQAGGAMLTRAIQQSLSMSGQQAEEYKRAYGFDSSQLEGKVSMAMEPVMHIMVGEIRKALHYYQSSQNNSNIRTLILTGGTSFLPGLTGYLSQALTVEVVVANPFSGLASDKQVTIPKDNATYAVALGLASNQI